VGTQQTCIGVNPIVGATFDAAEAAAISTWHADAVRVPPNEDCWLGINGAPRGMSAAAYRSQIEQWVSALNADGIVAILDLHWSAPGTFLSDRQWLTPDADHSPTFWTQVATTFTHTPGVIFDLFNEPALHDPHPTAPDWVCWLDGCDLTITMPTAAGGPEPTSGPQVTYQAVGYQQLVATVRATGADQPILISGLNFGNDPCDSWLHGLIGEDGTCTGLEPEPNDPEHQLAMSFHAYSWDRCVTVACWAPIASLAARRGLPLVITEFGEDDCSDGLRSRARRRRYAPISSTNSPWQSRWRTSRVVTWVDWWGIVAYQLRHVRGDYQAGQFQRATQTTRLRRAERPRTGPAC
jgi:hypothetical protein